MKLKTIISWLALVLIVGAFVGYISKNIEGFRQLSLASPYLITLIALLHVLFLVNNGLMLKLFMIPFRINLIGKEWFGLSAITSFGNYFIPGIGGATSRAVYLKKRYEFPYSRFLGNLAGNYIMVFLTNSFVALVALILAKALFGFWNWILFLIFLLIFLVALFFVLFHIRPFKAKWLQKANMVIEGWEYVRRSGRLVAGTILIGLMNIIVFSLLLFLEFRVFGFEIGILPVLIVALTSMLSIFINVTPAGLGIKEGLVVLTSTVFGIPPEIAVSVALIDRVVNLIVVFVLGPIFSYVLLKGNSKSPHTSAIAESRPSTRTLHSPNKIVELPLKKQKEGDKIVKSPSPKVGGKKK
ncbi:MAG: lysylphosphatidylglycerol synthase transmembrane domain-containing protein [archaeon]